MKTVTIADSLFLPHVKSAKCGGENADVGPTHFRWELADPQTARFVTDASIKHAKGEGQVAWLLEPFFLHPEDYIAAMAKPFDAVLSHNRWFVTNRTNWLWYAHGGSCLPAEQWGPRRKSRQVSLLISAKSSMPGHRLRHQVAEGLAQRFGVEVLGLSGWAPTVDIYAPYRYSIVIESERTPGYFTNRLVDCLAVGTVPIYWGAPDIGELFDVAGIIQVENYAGIQRALQNLPALPSMGVIVRNRARAWGYRICEDGIWSAYPWLFGEG